MLKSRNRMLFAVLFAVYTLNLQAAMPVFFDDFSSGEAAPEFSGVIDVLNAGDYAGNNAFDNNFLRNSTPLGAGQSGAITSLSLNGLAAHSLMTISFDLALIDSWDGADTGSGSGDFFNLTLDGTEIVEVSVDNALQSRTEIIPTSATNRITLSELFGLDGGDPCGFFCDSGFLIELTVAHTSTDAQLNFFADGVGWQGTTDESWAIDNVSISTNATVVPLPAALPLFAFAFALTVLRAARNRRRIR